MNKSFFLSFISFDLFMSLAWRDGENLDEILCHVSKGKCFTFNTTLKKKKEYV